MFIILNPILILFSLHHTKNKRKPWKLLRSTCFINCKYLYYNQVLINLHVFICLDQNSVISYKLTGFMLFKLTFSFLIIIISFWLFLSIRINQINRSFLSLNFNLPLIEPFDCCNSKIDSSNWKVNISFNVTVMKKCYFLGNHNNRN